MTEVVSSYNMFLNSDDGINNGALYDFQFGNTPITCQQGEFIRLTVNNFSMYRVWTGVNAYNRDLVLTTGGVGAGTGAVNSVVQITQQNYSTIGDLAANLADRVLTAYTATVTGTASAPNTLSAILPAVTTGVLGTTNNVISFTIDTTNAHGISAADLLDGNFALRCIVDATAGNIGLSVNANGADSALLLGGDRLQSTDMTSSCDIDVTSDVKKIVFTFKYPAQRTTEANMYLRSNPPAKVFATDNYQTTYKTGIESKLNPSNILAVMRIDTEFVQYNPTSGREYFADFYQKHMSHLQLFLTDSHNRAFPLFGVNQATLGNMHFSVCLRIDIMKGGAKQGTGVEVHNLPQLPKKVNAKKENLLIWQKDGKNMYGKPEGY